MTEAERIADQLLRAFEGDTWAGRSIQGMVAELSAEQAARHPLAGSHSAWEILRHIATWVTVATIRVGGRAHDPTDEETFGPIAPLIRFKDEEDAVRMANDTEFGLAAYVFAKDAERLWRVACLCQRA